LHKRSVYQSAKRPLTRTLDATFLCNLLNDGLLEPRASVQFCRYDCELPTKMSEHWLHTAHLASSPDTLPIRLKSISIAITWTIENLPQSMADWHGDCWLQALKLREPSQV